MGLSSKEEWDDYSCPGAYRLPKQPDTVWPNEWEGWDDWLGVPRPYGEALKEVRRLGISTKAEYDKASGTIPGSRLPARPELYYKYEWDGWETFLFGAPV